MTDPKRAERLWLAMAIATLWTVSVGCQAEASLPVPILSDLPEHHAARQPRTRRRRARPLSCFRRGRLLFPMLGAIAQFETELRAERQMDGIANAKARGVVFGRHKCLMPQQIAELQDRRQQGTLIRTRMRDYRISKATVYRYLSGAEADTRSR
jgi:hypothetical protein